MPSHQHLSAHKLLRRPLAPPNLPATKTSALPVTPPTNKRLGNESHQSRSLPSLASSIQYDEEEEEDENEELAFHFGDLSAIQSVAPSLASDLQEAQLAPQNTPKYSSKLSPTQRAHSCSANSPFRSALAGKTATKLALESRFRLDNDRTASLDPAFVPGSTLVKPYKPRGPDGFPGRVPRHPPEVRKEILYVDYNHQRYQTLPAFTLEDFQLQLPPYGSGAMHRETLKTALLSKQNYKKLTTLFASFGEVSLQESINTVELRGEEIPEVVPRIPQHQLLIEMAGIIRQQMRNMINDEMMSNMIGRPSIEPLALTTSMAALARRQTKSASSFLPETSGPDSTSVDAVFRLPGAKYFQGTRRSNSPFNEKESSTITPSELAILDCLVNGGLALSLKAHFIMTLPEISPLIRTLTYLNLSFNDFQVLPGEILSLRCLEILKLRNNPLRDLPRDINRLSKLRTLVLSFNLITTLPPSLFTLPLEFLDLSYNKLTFLPSEIRHLRSTLRELNVEGNQLAGMPCSALKLRRLRYLRVTNNFMHSLFWKENSRNEPQRLGDLASLVVKQQGLDERPHVLPDNLRTALAGYSICDCCQGPLYGRGLRILRPCSRAFGVRKLPFVFTSCSSSCRDVFNSSVESLTQMLYLDNNE